MLERSCCGIVWIMVFYQCIRLVQCFAFMLIIGGIILDKMGVRFTGMGACLLMVLGCGLKYYAISTTFAEGSTLLGMKPR